MEAEKYIQSLKRETEAFRQDNKRLTRRNDQLEKVVHELQAKIKEMLSDLKS